MTETVIQQWNRAAQAYMTDQEKSDFVQSNKKIVQERFQDLSGKTVLDLGCGYGWYTEYFRQVGAKAVGCDGAEKMIELSKKQYPECQFDVVDAEKVFPYENDTFDLVFCNQVLMDLENIDNLLDEVQRVLKPTALSIWQSYIQHFIIVSGEKMRPVSKRQRSWRSI